MPNSFYDGTTGIEPIDDTIRRILDTGYCHHIERLMVLGGFMFLCEIDPDDIYRWFMEMFVDSYDWVMVPNVYAMSQNADGGTITTKPYFSGLSYHSQDEPLQTGGVVRNLGWTVLAMDLESRGRAWKESKMGDDVQHGEEDEGQQAKATFGGRGGVRGASCASQPPASSIIGVGEELAKTDPRCMRNGADARHIGSTIGKFRADEAASVERPK